MFRIAFFASGGGHLIQRILDAYASDVRIKFVGLIGDEGADRSCKYAKAADVSIARLHRQRFSDLSEFNQALYQTVLPWEPNLIITTFNHIITNPVLDRWAGRIVNVHYALLPAFPGLKPIDRVIKHGVRFAGTTVHLIDKSIDGGPPIIQGVAPIAPDDSVDQVQDKLFHLAVPMIFQAIEWFVENRLVLKKKNGRQLVTVEDGRYNSFPINPYPENFRHLVPKY